MRKLLVLAALSASIAYAQQPVTLTIASGIATGTYNSMLNSIMAVCGDRVSIVNKNTGGSDDNVDLLAKNKVNGAFVQADTLQIESMNNAQAGPEKIKTLVTLYPEEVHVFALKDLSKTTGGINLGSHNLFGGKQSLDNLADLEGVEVGAWGGSMTTARAIALLGSVKYTAKEYPSRDTAFTALDRGEVAAIIAAGGQPLAWAETLSGQKYKLLKIDQSLAERVKVYQAAKLNYKNLNAKGLPTVAPRALLVVRNDTRPEYRKAFSDLKACMLEHEQDLKQGTGHHVKWEDVDFAADATWPAYAVDKPVTVIVNPKKK